MGTSALLKLASWRRSVAMMAISNSGISRVSRDYIARVLCNLALARKKRSQFADFRLDNVEVRKDAERKLPAKNPSNQGPLNRGVSRSGLALPFFVVFVLFGIFPICSGMVRQVGDFPDSSLFSFSAY